MVIIDGDMLTSARPAFSEKSVINSPAITFFEDVFEDVGLQITMARDDSS